MLGHGGSTSYLADPTSPIPSHCAVTILFQSVAVHQLSWLALKPLCSGMGEVVPARKCWPYFPHPLALCCDYPVSKCRSASIVATSTVKVNLYDRTDGKVIQQNETTATTRQDLTLLRYRLPVRLLLRLVSFYCAIINRSSIQRQKGLNGYCLKCIITHFYLQTDEILIIILLSPFRFCFFFVVKMY